MENSKINDYIIEDSFVRGESIFHMDIHKKKDSKFSALWMIINNAVGLNGLTSGFVNSLMFNA